MLQHLLDLISALTCLTQSRKLPRHAATEARYPWHHLLVFPARVEFATDTIHGYFIWDFHIEIRFIASREDNATGLGVVKCAIDARIGVSHRLPGAAVGQACYHLLSSGDSWSLYPLIFASPPNFERFSSELPNEKKSSAYLRHSLAALLWGWNAHK